MTRASEEKTLLLHSLYRDLLLRLGKEIGEPYCLQFDERGYDQNCRSFQEDEAIPKIAERVTDAQLVSFFAQPEIRARACKLVFRGKYYTLKAGQLSLQTEWVSIRAGLSALTHKHGGNLQAVLGACYKICVERAEQCDNYLKVQLLAKSLGANKGWRNALTDLELEGIVARNKGDISVPLELAPLIREFLDELAGETEHLNQVEEEEEIKIPEDLFDVVVGHDEVKKLFRMSLSAERPVHILLVGPPATAKSVFLSELERLPRSRYALGGTSSRAGVVDFMIENRPRYLLIDELDKMDMRDYSALLSLMESGKISRLKKGMIEEIQVKTWVFAAANREDNLPSELKSRFLRRYLSAYSEEDFEKVVRAVLVKRERVNQEIANIIANKLPKYTKDVRDAVKIARLYGKGQYMGVEELIHLVFGHTSQNPD